MEAISQGFQQKEIQDSAFAYQRAIETNDLSLWGSTNSPSQEPPPTGLLKVKEEVEISQKKALAEMKAKRDNDKVKEALAAFEAAAKGTG